MGNQSIKSYDDRKLKASTSEQNLNILAPKEGPIGRSHSTRRPEGGIFEFKSIRGGTKS